MYLKSYQEIKPLTDEQIIRNLNKNTKVPQADIWTISLTSDMLAAKGDDTQLANIFYHLNSSIKPKVIIFEGSAILQNQAYGQKMMNMIKTLQLLGYNTTQNLIKSYEYGGLTATQRLYIVATLDQIYHFPRRHYPTQVMEDIMDSKYIMQVQIGETKYDDNYRKSFTKPIKIGHINTDCQGNRVYSPKGIGVSVMAKGGGTAGPSGGLYAIDNAVYRLNDIGVAKVLGWKDEDIMAINHDYSWRTSAEIFGGGADIYVFSAIAESLKEIIK